MTDLTNPGMTNTAGLGSAEPAKPGMTEAAKPA